MNEQDKPKELPADIVTAFRLAVIILLAGIVVIQWQILLSIDEALTLATETTSGPTYGDIRKTRDRELRQSLIDVVPLIRIQNNKVRVTGTVSLDSASVAQIRGGQ